MAQIGSQHLSISVEFSFICHTALDLNEAV